MSDKTLLPCPFCDESDATPIMTKHDAHGVNYARCQLHTGWIPFRIWNHRPDHALRVALEAQGSIAVDLEIIRGRLEELAVHRGNVIGILKDKDDDAIAFQSEWEKWRTLLDRLAGIPSEPQRAALEIAEKWMKFTIEDTEWTDDAFAKQEHDKAKAELAIVRAALSASPTVETDAQKDGERLDWLEANPFIAYRDRDPESGKLDDHFTLVDEDEGRRRKIRVGIVTPTLREAIDEARNKKGT